MLMLTVGFWQVWYKLLAGLINDGHHSEKPRHKYLRIGKAQTDPMTWCELMPAAGCLNKKLLQFSTNFHDLFKLEGFVINTESHSCLQLLQPVDE